MFRWLPAALVAVGLAACGGGGYGGSSSTPPPVGKANVPKVAVGSITGFGSVHVNGVKFETTSATIKMNGQSATQGDLKVGQVVEVKGHHDDATDTDVAESIEFHHNVQGPISMIDLTLGTLTVLGQNVIVGADTSFDDSITPASLAGLAKDDIVEVSGMVATNGDIHATRIEKQPAGSPYEVIGTASMTDGVGKTLKINGLTVDFMTATLVDFPSTGPKDGDLVQASGTSLGSAGELKALRLELRTGKELKGEADSEGELEGMITRFASASDFDVAGHPVTTSTATTYEGGASTDLGPNVKVEVEGTVNSAGVLEAKEVKIRLASASATALVGSVESVDSSGTVTVLGITISVTDTTRFEDHTSAHLETFKVADVHTGDWLSIRGSESPADSNKIVATRFERIDPQSSVRLAGKVKTAAKPAFTILSVNVGTTESTQFMDAMDASTTADAFFTDLAGKVARVKGSWDGTTLTATEASLGEDHGGDSGED